MCTYCWLADWVHHYVHTPLPVPEQPWSPWTVQPETQPWNRPMLDELMAILQRVKEMEERLGGCPCEDASKMDFLHEIKQRLDSIEGKLDERDSEEHSPHPVAAGEVSD